MPCSQQRAGGKQKALDLHCMPNEWKSSKMLKAVMCSVKMFSPHNKYDKWRGK